MKNLEELLADYCQKYNVPINHLFKILEDQKVTPMIRGKAHEYNGYDILKKTLNENEWEVHKLNLNAQPGFDDQDISIRHRRSGVDIKVEMKTAVRDSFRTGLTTRKLTVPHFKVKSHKSRSSIKKANTTNDRYEIAHFDILLTTPINSIYQGNTIDGTLKVTDHPDRLKVLENYYDTHDNSILINKCRNDWRFTRPSFIAEDGFLPRTPYVQLKGDINWKKLDMLENELIEIVREKR
jgi:hypothetical protein